MTRRPWLPHPPRTIRPPACPTRLPRYNTLHHAQTALNHGLTHHTLTAWPCTQCNGAHTTESSPT